MQGNAYKGEDCMESSTERKITPKMTQLQVWSYGFGTLGAFVVTNLITQLTYFYTDKVGMTVGAVGSVMLSSKIADAFTDLVMGSIVDKTRSRYGKARPWLLWMTVPMLIAVFLLMVIPSSLGERGMFIYALITNIFASAIVATAINVPLSCLLVFSTNRTEDRTRMTVRQSICQTVIGALLTVGLVPLTNIFGGTQTAWIIVAMGFAGIAFIGMLTCFFQLKEQNTQAGEEELENPEDHVNAKEKIIGLLHDKYWVIMLLVILTAQIIYALQGSTGVYYAKWIFGDENLVGIMGVIGMIPTLIGFFAVTPIVNIFGVLKVNRASMLLTIACYGLKALFPYNFVWNLIFGALANATFLPFSMTYFVLQSKVCDYHVWKTGIHMEGLISSAGSFGLKIGAGLGTFLLTSILDLGGYQSKALVQPQSALNSIIIVSIYLPIVLLGIIYVLLRKYDLFEKYPQFR